MAQRTLAQNLAKLSQLKETMAASLRDKGLIITESATLEDLVSSLDQLDELENPQDADITAVTCENIDEDNYEQLSFTATFDDDSTQNFNLVIKK